MSEFLTKMRYFRKKCIYFLSIKFKCIFPPVSFQTPEETCWGLTDWYYVITAFDIDVSVFGSPPRLVC